MYNHKIVLYQIGYFLYQFGNLFAQKCLLKIWRAKLLLRQLEDGHFCCPHFEPCINYSLIK
jgi:hypothetical protein